MKIRHNMRNTGSKTYVINCYCWLKGDKNLHGQDNEMSSCSVYFFWTTCTARYRRITYRFQWPDNKVPVFLNCWSDSLGQHTVLDLHQPLVLDTMQLCKLKQVFICESRRVWPKLFLYSFVNK